MLPARNNQSWLPDVFNDFFNNARMVPAKATEPAINILEDKENYKIEVAAPGKVKENFHISIDDDNNLVVKMEENEKDEELKRDKDVRYWRHEFSYSKFQQAISLPDNIKKEDIVAKMENGILTVVLPKITEEDKAELSHVIKID